MFDLVDPNAGSALSAPALDVGAELFADLTSGWLHLQTRLGELEAELAALSRPRIEDPAPALVRFTRAMDEALDRIHGAEPLFLSAAEKAQTLIGLDRVEQRIRALKSTVGGRPPRRRCLRSRRPP